MHGFYSVSIIHAGPPARPLEDSIDEESINVLNARINQAERVSLDEAAAASAPLRSSSDDSSLAASFNQRLRELSVDEQAYDGPLTGGRLLACMTVKCVCILDNIQNLF